MIPKFKIEREGNMRYVIKRKAWLLPPLYEMRTMTKNEFIGDLTNYGDYVLSKEIATFKSKDQAYDALHQYAQIHGIVEVVVKIRDKW